MKAQVLTSAGDPSFTMGLEELVRPRPGPGEVLVKVRACGVCHTDLHVMKSEVAFPLPAVMGHEISGDIVELGAGVASSYASVQLKVGQAVTGVFILPCGTCTPCVRGDEDLCATFFAYNRGHGHLYDGSTRLHRPDGTPIAMYSMAGLAEYAVLPATAVHPLPASYSTGASYVNSSIVGCAVFTAYGAVHNVACLRSGESVAVLGVGGIGANVIQLARAQNADRIIAVDVNEEKLALARQMGATHTINASAAAKGGKVDVAEELRAFTDGRGVDVAFEALGRADTFVQAIGGLRDGGRAVMVGIAPAGVTAAVDITRLVRRKLQVLGSYGARARKDLPAIMRLLERGQIRIDEAVSRRFSLAQAGEAYKLLNEGKIIGRAVIDMQL
jgi:S-(hydroxymethyl)glutathione dehydrogenase/alcohol dehydrogenase